MSNQVQFTPIDTGDMANIPPDAPAGAWTAQCSVKTGATSKDKFPMLILEWRLSEALTDGNEDSVGGRVTDFVVFYPERHAASRMSKIRLRTMCDALGVELPAITSLKSWDDLADFIKELEGLKATIYTTIQVRRDTGEQQTRVGYTAPGASGKLRLVAADDDDEDEAPTKPAAPAAKKTKKK